MSEYEQMEFDVIIVGAGPAGLAAAIRYAQCCQKNQHPVRLCVLEKGSEVGAHLLSGAVLDTRVLNNLLPEWVEKFKNLTTSVTQDRFYWLTQKNAFRLPTPPPMKNTHDQVIISLGELCRYLATEAQALGIEIYPGFAATELLLNQEGAVIGVITGDLGLNASKQPKAQYQKGIQLKAKQTLIAEGARGFLAENLKKRFNLTQQGSPQTYALGLKELWRISPHHPDYKPGTVLHTIGWPLCSDTYGGSFIYHLKDHKIALGFVVGLDYKNPYLNPYLELQRFKHHPMIQPLLEHGECLAYGARCLTEGGFQSIPKLTFPGGALIGCSAGFLNVPQMKGIHTAMQSGLLAAEAVFEKISNSTSSNQIISYEHQLKNSWVWKELYQARNIRPAFQRGLYLGLAYSAIDTYVLKGKAPWTLQHPYDYKALQPAKKTKPIDYPKPDGQISFDKLTNLARSNTYHEADQPCHLVLKDKTLAITVNEAIFSAPETRYCPANVYEIVEINQKKQLQINAQNCLHCKACDIKDPNQNIKWTPPEGGGGPNYHEL